MNKKFIYVLTLCLFSPLSYAENTIFKCIDSDGNTSYLNSKNNNSNCSKTDLANVDKIPTISSSKIKSLPSFSNNNSMLNSSIKDEEQQVRDTKRLLVLKKELSDEQEQLDTVNNMIQKTDSKDATQLNKLKEMQTLHQQNITALNKELGNVKPANLLPVIVTSSNNPPSFLPTSLPANVNVLNTNTPSKPIKNLTKVNSIIRPPIVNTIKKAIITPVSPVVEMTPSQFLLGQ